MPSTSFGTSQSVVVGATVVVVVVVVVVDVEVVVVVAAVVGGGGLTEAQGTTLVGGLGGKEKVIDSSIVQPVTVTVNEKPGAPDDGVAVGAVLVAARASVPIPSAAIPAISRPSAIFFMCPSRLMISAR
jgi:hypothetical protein